MKLSLDWTLENRSPPLGVRVTAEARWRQRWNGEDAAEIECFSCADMEGRPVDTTPEEEREIETALLCEADRIQWCQRCGQEPQVKLGECSECLRLPMQVAS